MSKAIFLAVVAVTQFEVNPRPLDAFRANYAAIKVDMEFIHTSGRLDTANISEGLLWAGEPVGFAGTLRSEIVGQWSCDGTTEYYYCGSPDEVIANSRAKGAQKQGDYAFRNHVPKVEGLFDGNILAEHTFDPLKNNGQIISVWIDGGPPFAPSGKGPFSWFDQPFPRVIEKYFLDFTPRLVRTSWDGIPVEVEIYRKELPSGWRRLEVAYDPSRGYIPRRTRMLASSPGEPTYVREIYVTATESCAAGGIVPTEWFEILFSFDEFENAYPSSDESTRLVPEQKTISARRFQATSLQNRSRPVALTHLEDVHSISSIGGQVSLRSDRNALTLAEIKRILGAKLTDPISVPLPTLDAAELREFERPSRRPWIYVAVITLVGLIIGAALILRRRFAGRFLVFGWIVVAAVLPGCGYSRTEVVKLTVGFDEPITLYDVGSGALPVTLLASNDGNQALRIYHVDGGCACRQVDQSDFPRVIRPGEYIEIPLKYNPGRATQPQPLNFTFETDHGSIPVATLFYAMPRHLLDPESPLHLSMVEDENWEFVLTHRSIVDKDKPELKSMQLVVPTEFTAEELGTHEGDVAGVPNVTYKDTKYRIKLIDARLGLHKRIIYLTDQDGSILAESSVMWKRVPYLTSLPDRITLGDQARRVFLRCPDEEVELARVISSPPGIETVITSPRELIVGLTDETQATIRGTIEVETTAESHPPLRIPVVHYGRQSEEVATKLPTQTDS